jgi:undecaprenyl diphosphate synthase
MLPRHIAIVMDGNGRWARARRLPRAAGHKQGVDSTRRIVEHCARLGVEVLTLFAFSSENWRRPASEVDTLMDLFRSTLRREIGRLTDQGVRLRFIGDVGAFPDALRGEIARGERRTSANQGLRLNIAVNYGGRWDVTRAARELAREVSEGRLDPERITPEMLSGRLSTAGLREPDLFIRTGGEQRISNFLLWQLAYTELIFTEVLWPDFDEQRLDDALAQYAGRQRRFGRTAEQIENAAADA